LSDDDGLFFFSCLTGLFFFSCLTGLFDAFVSSFEIALD
jgi:hypothetical protein